MPFLEELVVAFILLGFAIAYKIFVLDRENVSIAEFLHRSE
jgi:hypothetical protein